MRKIIITGAVVCSVLLIFALGFGWWVVTRGLPSISELRTLQPTHLSKIVAADGSIIGCYPPGGMVILADADIPDTMKKAFISAEDATYYQHAGIDFSRIVSALIKDIKAASFVQGASTITQQVVRTYLLTRERTIYRKVREAILAVRIERSLSKDQILNLYLNRLYLGSGAYGVGAASLRYFGRDLKDLTLPEMSMIAGLAPAPHRYSPLNSFTAAKNRQWYVLKRMVQEGYIRENEAIEAYQAPLRITAKSMAMYSRYPYITDYLKNIVTEKFSRDVFNNGLIIKTSIVPRLQDAAELAAIKGAIEVEMRQGKYKGPLRGMEDAQKRNLIAFQKNQITWENLKDYELYWGEVVGVSPLMVNIGSQTIEIGPESYNWINPKGRWNPKNVLRTGDMIKLCYVDGKFQISQDPMVQTALIAFDIQNHSLLAMVGGIDYARNQFNRALYAKRQSGSAIKPFIYSAALDKGYTPATIVLDTPLTYKQNDDDEGWKPQNYSNRFYGPTSLRTGLVMSRNIVTVKILKDIGLGYTLRYLKHFDMKTKFPRDLSLALGSGVVTPYNLTSAYGTFASYGKKFEATAIDVITTSDGVQIFVKDPIKPLQLQNTIQDSEFSTTGAILENQESDAETQEDLVALPLSEAGASVPSTENKIDGDAHASLDQADNQAIPASTAYIITNILTDVVAKGTGWRARTLGRPVAGKTGTSDDYKDAWFIGFTPDIVCGVWVGYDDMVSLGPQEAGGTVATPIFVDFMKVALNDRPILDFQIPTGVVFAQVNSKTGQLVDTPSEDTRFECFKESALPAKEETAAENLMLKEVF